MHATGADRTIGPTFLASDRMSGFSVLILGGYGLFGSHIARRLAREVGWRVVIAGRDGAAAIELCDVLRQESRCLAELAALACDAYAPGLSNVLTRQRIQLVINTCGPFQKQDYTVARAVLAAGAHYIDLADARDFVAAFEQLDAEARSRGRLAVCGASTVPGLSAAVVDGFRDEFKHLETVDIGISPGNRTPRGLATVAAILSYVGRPLPWREQDHRREVAGWQRLQRWDYPAPVGARWLGACDVPDLGLFPRRYPELRELRFRAGLELRSLHFGLWLLSWLVRARLLRGLERHASRLKSISEWLVGCGSDAGAMHVDLRGVGIDGKRLRVVWQLIATHGDGPQIPATAAVLLARKLARGELSARGAMPCIGLFTLQEFIDELDGYAIAVELKRS